MDWQNKGTWAAGFLILFGGGDIIYQILCINMDISNTTQLWDAFLFAGRWHDVAGGSLCLLAGIGMLKQAAWGNRLGFVMASGYLNLLAYLCLMFYNYTGELPAAFFNMPLSIVQALFTILLLCTACSVSILWRIDSARS